MNEIKIKGVYDYIKLPNSALDIAHNLGYELGASTVKDNRFTRALERLVKNGTLTKVYDIKDEGLYNFVEEQAQISFFGDNLYYNY